MHPSLCWGDARDEFEPLTQRLGPASPAGKKCLDEAFQQPKNSFGGGASASQGRQSSDSSSGGGPSPSRRVGGGGGIQGGYEPSGDPVSLKDVTAKLHQPPWQLSWLSGLPVSFSSKLLGPLCKLPAEPL